MSNQTLLQHFSIGSRIAAQNAEKKCARGNLLTAMNSTAANCLRKHGAIGNRQPKPVLPQVVYGIRNSSTHPTKGSREIRFIPKEWSNFVKPVT